VATEEGRFVGIISLNDLRRVLIFREGLELVLLAEDVTNEGTPVCHPDDSLSQAMIRFERSGLPELPVVDRATGALVGELRHQDVVVVYNNEILMQDTAEGMAARTRDALPGQKVRLVEGYDLAEWDPPASFRGRRLMQLRLPRRYGVHVILIKRRRPDERAIESFVPDADTVIGEHDTVLIYGRSRDVNAVLML
jgi:hypothetical protein